MTLPNTSLFQTLTLVIGFWLLAVVKGCGHHHNDKGGNLRIHQRRLTEQHDNHNNNKNNNNNNNDDPDHEHHLKYDPNNDHHHHHHNNNHRQLHDGNPTDGGWCATAKATTKQKLEAQRITQQYIQTHGRKLSASFSVVVPTYWFVIYKTDGTGYMTAQHIADSMDVLNAAFAGNGFSFQLMGTQYVVNDDWFQNDNQDVYKAALRPATATAGDLLIYTTTAGDGTLGYAYYPYSGSNRFYKDGIVLDYKSAPGFYSYYEGDTLTHEVGHWLGVYHTFNDDTCSGTRKDLDFRTVIEGDGVDDTPVQYSPSSGCPIGRNSCPNNPGVDPIHNFMDYSNDACVNEFTEGQFVRMRAAWTTYRAPYHTPPTLTSGVFSDESGNNIGKCPTSNGIQTILKTLACSGTNCDFLEMTCTADGTVANDPTEGAKFSDENGGIGSCDTSKSNQVITGLRCQGQYCDNSYLICQTLTSVTLDTNNCGVTPTFPSTQSGSGSETIPDETYPIGINCSGPWCSYKAIRYCYAMGATAAPTPAPTPSPVSGPIIRTIGPFSDENPNNTGDCPVVNGVATLLSGLGCSGTNCDQVTMTCYNSGSDTVADDAREGPKFSDENGGVGSCSPSLSNAVITKIRCQGKYCDNMYLTCQTLTSATLDTNNCGVTSIFPAIASTSDSKSIPAGSFGVGINCSGPYCAYKAIRYCYPVGSTGAVTATVGPFSDENPNNTGDCPVVNGVATLLSGLGCSGTNCDQVTMTCYNSGSDTVADDAREGPKFSDENGGVGSCSPSLSNAVITKIRCQGKYCDNMYLTCQTLTSATLDTNNCGVTSIFPAIASTSESKSIPAGSFGVGVNCSGPYCAYKAIRYCYPVGAGPAPTPAPTLPPTPSPGSCTDFPFVDNVGDACSDYETLPWYCTPDECWRYNNNGETACLNCCVCGGGSTAVLDVNTIEFSDENDGRGDCPIENGFQTLLIGIRCNGERCDNLRLTCSWRESALVSSAVTEVGQFSEEQGIGSCPTNNSVITSVRCRGDYCDNLFIYCQELTNLALNYNNCAETASITSDTSSNGYEAIPDGAFAVAITCSGGYCSNKTIRYCYPS